MENISNQITFMKKGLLSLSTLLLLCVGAFAQDDEKAIKEAALKPKGCQCCCNRLGETLEICRIC